MPLRYPGRWCSARLPTAATPARDRPPDLALFDGVEMPIEWVLADTLKRADARQRSGDAYGRLGMTLTLPPTSSRRCEQDS